MCGASYTANSSQFLLLNFDKSYPNSLASSFAYGLTSELGFEPAEYPLNNSLK